MHIKANLWDGDYYDCRFLIMHSQPYWNLNPHYKMKEPVWFPACVTREEDKHTAEAVYNITWMLCELLQF